MLNVKSYSSTGIAFNLGSGIIDLQSFMKSNEPVKIQSFLYKYNYLYNIQNHNNYNPGNYTMTKTISIAQFLIKFLKTIFINKKQCCK